MASEVEGLEVLLRDPSRHAGVGLRQLRPWLEALVVDLAGDLADSFSAVLVTDREMRRLNRTFRGKDQPTDVLSFPGQEGLEGRHLGDVAVAVPTARRQATVKGHSLHRELQILMLHGLLHCLGYDHESDDGTMERLERRLRRRWLSDG